MKCEIVEEFFIICITVSSVIKQIDKNYFQREKHENDSLFVYR